ncbi:hypothetical protein [Roseomonas populi]|uniref:DUF4124 domain-containing protein n=1 Tax=Roseomonas populi TaxID=3121582 RepID=A0ABT1X239_9PROT|nr:hypothetical protein [Roseomonas pecuniae]MCR0981789.1 hypothetical protein [Roseomonas pecuniae]
MLRRGVYECDGPYGVVLGSRPAPPQPPPPPPAQARENSLLEDALSGRPDYTAALRRAAEANISEENPVVRQSRAAREARIDAEVARLSDAVEKRRREVLAQHQQQQRSAQDQAAIDACQARGQTIEASMYRSRSLLNLEASAAGVQARDACIQNYLRSR